MSSFSLFLYQERKVHVYIWNTKLKILKKKNQLDFASLIILSYTKSEHTSNNINENALSLPCDYALMFLFLI